MTSKAFPNQARRALAAHAFCVYDLNLRLKWGTVQPDLLASLPREQTYLIDNNVPWKKLSVARPDVNFVLGCTISEEAENLDGVLFSRLPSAGYANVFDLDIMPQSRELIVVHRLDKHYRAGCFARPIPTLSNNISEHQADQLLSATSLKFQLVSLLAEDPNLLQARLERDLLRCQGNFFVSAQTAVVAMAIFFRQLKLERQLRKLDPAYIQLPGDTRLIAEALLFGFPILSQDERDVHAMAKIAGIKAVKTENL